jgi:YVTN family beta-propeller protein
MRALWLGLAAILFAALLSPQPPARLQVGPLSDGGTLLDTAWIVRPAGRQVPLGAFPMATALSPDGQYLLVLNGGYAPPSISVLDVAQAREIERTPVPDAWLGLAFSSKGDRVYAGGGAQAAVMEFSFSKGRLQPARTFPVVDAAQRTSRDFIGDVALSPDGRLIYAADLYRDSIVVINPQSGRVIERFKTGRRPYRILFHPDGKSFFVSSWADGSVLRHGTENGEVMTRLRLAPHPTDMVWLAGRPKTDAEEEPSSYVARIFVATANTNSVHTLGVTEANDVRPIEAISLAMTQRQPLGMTPSALGVDGARLYVACSDANAVAVADVSGSQARVLGLLPVGAYPTAVRPLAGGRLAVVNGKGAGSPMAGTASFIDPFTPPELESYTRTVFENSPYRDSIVDDVATGDGNPIPERPGDSSPIENLVYIIKGGLAYDEVLGDLKLGNGDPSLVRFGEAVTPNHHKLAREFVLFDNFYRNGDSFEEGIYWATAAIAPDYVQKLWGEIAARRRDYTGFDGSEPAAVPPAGYLWTNAIQAGISLRNYGCFPKEASLTRNTAAGSSSGPVALAQLFLRDLAGYQAPGQRLPRLLTACLSGDSVGDVDRALGMIVEGVSRSRFWPKTAIFVVEAGGLAGKDHVDGRRSPAFVISPYARRRGVDSTLYNTLSVLRTIELILGLHPMTHFDAAALPLSVSFQTTPDVTPYQSAASSR